MLDKKIRKNLLKLSPLISSSKEWLEKPNLHNKPNKNGLIYNIFDNEWVKNYIIKQQLINFHFIKASKIKKFIEENPEHFNLLLKDFQKKAVKLKFEIIIGNSSFFDPELDFNIIKNELVNHFKKNDKNDNAFMNLALEVYQQEYLDKNIKVNNEPKETILGKQETYTQQNFNELKHEIMPNTLMIVPKLYGETFDFQDDNIVYHLADRQWLNEYFFNKAAQTQMCQNGNLAEVFLNSKEFNAQIKRYQNQLVNYAINTSSMTPTGIVTINKNLPLEQSQAILKEQTITSLANNFKMDLSLVNEKELDKKIEKICTSYYEGTLQIQPYTNEIIESDQDDFSPLWPSK